MKLLSIAIGGAIGTLMRYIISGATHRVFNTVFPLGTLFVNLAGSFFIGFLWAVFAEKIVDTLLRGFVFVGLLGGFTTFSTYAFESMNLIKSSEYGVVSANIVLNNLLGIMLVFAGHFAGRWILSRG